MKTLFSWLICSMLLTGCSSPMWQWVITEQDRKNLREVTRNAVACQLSQSVQTPMRYRPLYQWQQGQCEAVAVRNRVDMAKYDQHMPAVFYADHFCRQPVDYQFTRYDQFCRQYSDAGSLGDAVSLSENAVGWTLDPATRLALPVEHLYMNYQPYMKRFAYLHHSARQQMTLEPNLTLNVRRGSGECVLEMRVYKADLIEKNLKPLLMLSSSSLLKRGFDSLAVQSQISLYTDEGFLVFMPFLRSLVGGEGPIECAQASFKNLQFDLKMALKWIKKHQKLLGGNGGKITIVAKGSSALLATGLFKDYAEDISSALFLYPLLNSRLLLTDIQQGRYIDQSGIRIVKALLNEQRLKHISLDDERLQDLSFEPWFIKQHPIMVLHGVKDRRIPVNQTKNLCIDSCRKDRFILLESMGHQFDYCLLGIECPAGDRPLRLKAREFLKHSRLWLKESSQ